MPNFTTHLQLEKPTPEDFYDVEVLNKNWDKIDEELPKRVSQTRTINKKPLSADVTLTGEDIPAGAKDEKTLSSHLAELAEVRASLSNKADRGESWVPESWMTIPVGKRLWFYTGGKMGYYILNNGIELSIYDHDNNNLLSLLSSRAPTINNGISLATVTPPQKQNISLLNGVQPTDSGCVFWKQQDNVCTVAIACTKPTDGLTPDMIIGTLPVGFRPSYIERAGYAATLSAQMFPANLRIYDDGNIQIWFPNTSANLFVAEASFPVRDNGGTE